MATESLFIAPSEIKNGTNVDENVDEKIIREAIIVAQDLEIKQIIGSGLFDELQAQIAAGTVSAVNASLLQQIAKALKWWTIYHGAYGFQFKLMNKGVIKRESDSSTTVEKVDLVAVMDDARGKAQEYSNRLSSWMLQHEASYPLYNNPGDGFDVIHPRRSQTYDPGIYLGRHRHTDYTSFLPVSYDRKNNCHNCD